MGPCVFQKPESRSNACAGMATLDFDPMRFSQSSQRRSTAWFWIALAALVTFVVVFARNAWVIDDAYITFRTVDHFLHGRGLIWNPGERVQAYTHPLWMFATSAWVVFTGEYFYTTLALSLACCLAAIAVGSAGADRARKAALLVLLTVASKAAMDYSSSGLENPLSYALSASIVLLACRCMTRVSALSLGSLWLAASLAYVNRADTILLFIPVLLLASVRAMAKIGVRGTAGGMVVGGLPAVLWTGFSLFYYGFPFPNTFYAKAGSVGVDRSEVLLAGARYFRNSLTWDPLTLLVIALAGLFLLIRGTDWARALVVGVGIYLAFIVSMGAAATHMSGRLLSVPFFLTSVVLVQSNIPRGVRLLTAGGALASALLLPAAPWKANTSFYAPPGRNGIESAGLIDARYLGTMEGGGLLTTRPGPVTPSHPWLLEGLRFRDSGSRVKVGGAGSGLPIGFFGFGAGPNVFIIDRLGLSDPLLARLPMSPGTRWWPGHYERRLPDGYSTSVVTGQNAIQDPVLHRYYDKIRLVTRGPLWSWERMRVVAELNFSPASDLDVRRAVVR
jgi:arabinofuranosyltransferase